jgi:hypothetical protein
MCEPFFLGLFCVVVPVRTAMSFIAQTRNSQQRIVPCMPTISVLSSYSSQSPSVSEICVRVNERVENAIIERRERACVDMSGDQDRGKGAVEQDSKNEGGNTSMQVNWGTVMPMQS